MQERQVTVGRRGTYRARAPFFVLATQNPIEQEGTYPLPEAQLDRFMFNIVMTISREDDEVRWSTQTTGAAATAVDERADRRRHPGVPAGSCVRCWCRMTSRATPCGWSMRRGPVRRGARLREGVGEVGRRAARVAGADPRRQGARADARPLSRLDRRHPGAGRAGAAPPHHHELLRRVGAVTPDTVDRTAARRRAGAEERACAIAVRPRRLSCSRRESGALLEPQSRSHGSGSLELKARTIVEGLLSGLHRSPFRGFSAEFAEYRQYCRATISPRSTGRSSRGSDRYYVKKYEAETNLECTSSLDISASMGYATGGDQQAANTGPASPRLWPI